MQGKAAQGGFLEDHIASLCAELKAIELWNDCYFAKKVRHESDEISYRARRERWQEIMREISTSPRSEHEAARQQSEAEFGQGATPTEERYPYTSIQPKS